MKRSVWILFIEAAAYGKTIIVGPYMYNFIEETEIQVINFEGLYDVSVRDIHGKIVLKLNNLSDNQIITPL